MSVHSESKDRRLAGAEVRQLAEEHIRVLSDESRREVLSYISALEHRKVLDDVGHVCAVVLGAFECVPNLEVLCPAARVMEIAEGLGENRPRKV